MGRWLAFVLILAACGGGSGDDDADGGVDAPPSAACQEATTYQNLSTIETKIFKTSCVFSGCHNGANTKQGMMDLREGAAFAHLINVDSMIDTTRKIVVPGDPAASYMLLMLGEVAPGDAKPPGSAPPASIGLMPQNAGSLLCNEKREAISRWIMAGANDD
jgi:hypothetical protein